MGMTEPAILSPTTGSKGADPFAPCTDYGQLDEQGQMPLAVSPQR